MKRKACAERGHRWAQMEGLVLPVEFCARWFCKAERVAGWVSEPLASSLQAAIDRDPQ